MNGIETNGLIQKTTIVSKVELPKKNKIFLDIFVLRIWFKNIIYTTYFVGNSAWFVGVYEVLTKDGRTQKRLRDDQGFLYQTVSIPIIKKNIGDVNLLFVKKLNVRPKPSLLAMILFEHLMNIAMILQLINYNSNISMEIKMFIRFLDSRQIIFHWCLMYILFLW